MGLVRSEFLRARSRRIVPLAIVGSAIGILIGVTIGAIVSPPEPGQGRMERAERQYERHLQDCLDGRSYRLEESGYDSYEHLCADFVRLENFAPEGMKIGDLASILDGTASLVILLGGLLGATLGGADWSAGTMTTLLTWEPRRHRIFTARALVIASVTLAMAVSVQFWLGVVFAGGVAIKGTFAGTADGFAVDLLLTAARVGAVAMLFSLVGLSFATIGRSTVSGVSFFLGYLILVELFLANLVFVLARFTLGRAAGVAVTGKVQLLTNQNPPRNPRPDQVDFLLVPGRAWVSILAWVAALLAIAAISFRQRDVT